MPCNPAEVKNGMLLVGMNASDTAQNPTPRPLPDGTAYYLSPNVRLLGGISDGQARVDPNPANTPNHFIEVNVANISNQAVQDVKIEVWVCNFTMGITPSSSLASSNPNGLPMEGFVAGPINPQKSLAITCGPWKPTAADAALNGGHVCIAANCYLNDGSDGSPLSLRPAPVTNTFSFLCDTHHAQRNVAIVVQSAATHGAMMFHMTLANPLPAGNFAGTIEIQRTQTRDAIIGAIRDPLRANSQIAFVKGGPRDLEAIGGHLVMSKDLTFARTINGGRYLLRLGTHEFAPLFFSKLQPDFKLVADGLGAGQNLPVTLKERQVHPLNVQLKFDAAERPGATHVFDLVQRDKSGKVLGGARILVVLAA